MVTNRPLDALSYGVVCRDTVWQASIMPPPGGYARVLHELRIPAGEAVNTAIALHRWGLRVAVAGNLLGDDDDGHAVRDDLARLFPEVDLAAVRIEPGAVTPTSLCIASPDGNRTIFGRHFEAAVYPRPPRELLRRCRVLTVDGCAGQGAQEACRLAHEAGIPVVSMDCVRLPEVLRLSTIAQESSEHFPPSTIEDLARRAEEIRDQSGAVVVITCGERGAVCAPETGAAFRVPAYPAPAMIDSTGAGDCFRAGIVCGLVKGWRLEETLRFASAAGALNCGGLGAWGGLCSLPEVLAFQQQSPVPAP